MSLLPSMILETEDNKTPRGTETSGVCLTSPDVVLDGVNCEFLEATGKGRDELKQAEEVLEVMEREMVPPIETSGMYLESPDGAMDVADGELQEWSSNQQNEAQSKTETSGMVLTYPYVALDGVNYELQEEIVKGHDELKQADEVLEVLEHETVPPVESSEMYMGSPDGATDAVEGELLEWSSNKMNEAPPDTETSGMGLTSPNVIPDAVNYGLQEVLVKEQYELKLDKEVLRGVEPEVIPPVEASELDWNKQDKVLLTEEVVQGSAHEETSLYSDLQSYPANSMGKSHEEESNKSLASDVIKNKKCDIASSIIFPVGLATLDGIVTKLCCADQHVEKVCEPLFEGKDFSVIHVQDKVHNGEESKEYIHYSGLAPVIMLPETDNETPESIESFLASNNIDPHMKNITSNAVESYPVNNNAMLHEEEAKEPLDSDVLENCKYAINPSISVPTGMEKVDETETAFNNIGQPVERLGEPIFYENEFSVTCVKDNVPNSDGTKEKFQFGVSPDIMLLEIKNENLESSERILAPNDLDPHKKFIKHGVETFEPVFSKLVGSAKVQITEYELSGDENSEISATTVASSASDSAVGPVICTKDSSFRGDYDPCVDCEVLRGEAEASVWPPATDFAKSEPEVHYSTVSNDNLGVVVTATCKIEILHSFDVDEEGTSNIEMETAVVKDMGDQLVNAAGSHDEKLFMLGNDGTGNCSIDNSVAPADGSSMELIAGERSSFEAFTQPFNFLIRIPRFNDDIIKEQIRLAKLQVDEKTTIRDAIRLKLQEKRASSQIHGLDYEYAKNLDRNARRLVWSKRKEIASLQSKINIALNAISIAGVDSNIYKLEHIIQHETLPLKEEKLIIREIKQMKLLRSELSSNMGSQDEIQQALEQKPELEERLPILKKELNVLKGRVLEAEAAAFDAEQKFVNEIEAVKELQTQFKIAADARLEAYAHWQSLRKELVEKNNQFFKYKDAAAAARNYAYDGDTEGLYNLCKDQVDKMMELWNTNDSFRMEYVKFNAGSTLRRFGTLDGRSLGPDEEPPVLPSYAGDRTVSPQAMVDSASQNPGLQLKQELTTEGVSSDGEIMKTVSEYKNQAAENKGLSKPALVNMMTTYSRRNAINLVNEDSLTSWEEIELVRKQEEMRGESAEAELREQRRLEALEKANLARERKKRQADKIQMRAELKAQKDAEQREKEREKRLKKKERKKAGTDVNDSSDGSGENGNEMEAKGFSSSATVKKPKKSSVFVKQSKTKSIPPALRNRNKKKWQQYAGVCATCLFVVVLFWLGNVGLFSNVSLRRHAPV